MLITALMAVAGAWAQVDFSEWPNRCNIKLNTTASGANISKTVTDFPVLLRLDPGNFEGIASQTAFPEDIQFSKADGTTPLPFEVNEWKYGTMGDDTALVWVRVDSIKGNDSSQYIIMYWGKVATDTSNGPAVFDTARGFVSAWHLEDDELKDAGANQNTGTNFFSNSVPGVIGNCRVFDAERQTEMVAIFSNPTLNPVQQLTYSAWFKTGQTVAVGSKVSVIRHDNHFSALELSGAADNSKAVLRSSLFRKGDQTPSGFDGIVGIKYNTAWVTAGGEDILSASASHLLLYEMFKKINNADGTVSFIAQKNRKFVGLDPANDGRLVATTMSSANAARFNIVANSDTTFFLQASNGKYVTIPEGSALYANGNTTGTPLYFDYYVSDENVVAWDNPQYRPATFAGVCGIISRAIGNHVSVMTDQELVMTTAEHYMLNEQYTKVNNGDGTVSFISEKTHKYLGVDAANNNRLNALKDTQGATEKFTLEVVNGKYFTLKASNGKYLSPTGDSYVLEANTGTPGLMEQFYFYFPLNGQLSGSAWDVADEQWHFFAATYSATEGYKAYLDGSLACKDTTLTGELQASPNTMYLGGAGESGQEYYTGMIDEVELHKVARGPEWIKLCYENQKPDQKLVTIGAMTTPVLGRGAAVSGTAFSLDCASPFVRGARIRFSAPQGARVSLGLYTVRGQLVRSLLADSRMSIGSVELVWDGRDAVGAPLSSGSYVLRLTLNGNQSRSRLLFTAR